MDWQTIDTLPKKLDEADCLAETHFDFMAGPAVAFDGKGKARYMVWYKRVSRGMSRVTHWAPLPSGPK